MASSDASDPGDRFLERVVGPLVDVPGVVGVVLGGSRARGRARPDSDWDLGVFVDDRFSVAAARAAIAGAGWTGSVAELGEWGPVMNGGAWLEVEGRRVDLLWRETATVERLIADAEEGTFTVVRIPFFLAGIPTYVPVGELWYSRCLWGAVPPGRPMPPALRARGREWWLDNARFDLDYSRVMTGRGDVLVGAALLARVLVQLAHARQCAAGAWVLNEKGLLVAAGLDDVGRRVAAAAGSSALARCQDEVEELLSRS